MSRFAPSLFQVSERVRLRPYQTAGVQAVRDAFRAGHKRVILCAATGSGKTHIAAAMIHAAIAKHGGPVLFLADRTALIEQTSERLATAGIRHGVVSGQLTVGEDRPVLLCSVQTLTRRGFPPAKLVIVDEAHDQYAAVRKWLTDTGVPSIGLTATPLTRGLGRTWNTVVNVTTTDWLTENGWLVPLDVYVGKTIDMRGAKVASTGEWTPGVVADRAIPLVGDVVGEYQRRTQDVFGGPVKTVVFASTVAHANELATLFSYAGLRFAPVTYRGNTDARREAIAEFRQQRSDLMGLITVDALGKGADFPDVRCLVSARPFRRSLSAWIQQLGRGLRPALKKDRCLLLDHAGNFLRHADAVEQFWVHGCLELDDGKRRKRGGYAPPKRLEKERECLGCHLVMPSRVLTCPGCGRTRKPKPADVPVEPGQLKHYRRLRDRVGDIWPHLSRLAANRGKERGWAAKQYQVLTGRWPPRSRDLELTVTECDSEVERRVNIGIRNWVARKSRERKERDERV